MDWKLSKRNKKTKLIKKINHNVPIVLASSSPRRRRIMKSLPWKLIVRPSQMEEPKPRGKINPRLFVQQLAKMKALDVVKGIKQGLVLGADTVVFHRGRILGKPESVLAARGMLSDLQGNWHRVYTGLALVGLPGGKLWKTVWMTRVKMKSLSVGQLDYWAQRNHDKAGAYSAQDPKNPFIESYRGDFDNVVGLPQKGVRVLLQKAKTFGYEPLKKN